MGEKNTAKLISDMREKTGAGNNLLDGGDEDTDKKIVKLVRANEQAIKTLERKLEKLAEDISAVEKDGTFTTKVVDGKFLVKDTTTGEWHEQEGALKPSTLPTDKLTKKEKLQEDWDKKKQRLVKIV
tara:strand:- start:1869 stop:2249 length:381 start_codon:yes stop_codon:yes gene_type:complete